jgi:hypothetical protein
MGRAKKDRAALLTWEPGGFQLSLNLKRTRFAGAVLLFAALLAGGAVAYNTAASRSLRATTGRPGSAHARLVSSPAHDGRGPHKPPMLKQVIGQAIFFATHLAV